MDCIQGVNRKFIGEVYNSYKYLCSINHCLGVC